MSQLNPCANCGNYDFEDEDGVLVCTQCGRQQEGGLQVADDSGDFGTQGKISRKKVKKTKVKVTKSKCQLTHDIELGTTNDVTKSTVAPKGTGYTYKHGSISCGSRRMHSFTVPSKLRPNFGLLLATCGL